MKNYSFAFLIVLFFTTILTSCGSDERLKDLPPQKTHNNGYECPMKCTEEIFDAPGKCPVCEMELLSVSIG